MVTSSAGTDMRIAAGGSIRREDSELLGASFVEGQRLVPSKSMRGLGPESETEGEETESDGYQSRTTGSFPAPPTTLPGSGGVIQGLHQFPAHSSAQPLVTRRLGSPPRGGLSRISSGSLRGASSANSSARHRSNEDPTLMSPVGSNPQYRSSAYYVGTPASPPPAYLTSGSVSGSRGSRRQTAGSEMTAISSMGSLASSSNSAASHSELGPVTPPPVNASVVTPWAVVGASTGGLEGGGRSLDPIEETSTYGKQVPYGSGSGSGGLESAETTPTHRRTSQGRPSSTSTGDGTSLSVNNSGGASFAYADNKSSSADSSTPINGTPNAINGQLSPSAPGSVMSKYDKEVEKQRKKLEKVEKKAFERREKDEKERWEKEEKRRRKLTEKPDPQILADRMKYMGVMGFGR